MGWAGRTWLPSLPGGPTGKNRFTVVSYHVTAEEHSKRIAYVRPHLLSWSYRRNLLLREVLSYDADVLCLQDVDHFDDWWQPQLAVAGYDCVYKQRRSLAFSYPEGVCIAYKRDVFQVFRTCEVDLNDAVSLMERDAPFPVSQVAQNNVGLILHLQPAADATQTVLCVANTQLCTQEELDLIRVLQLVYFTKRIEEENLAIQAPVILCANIAADPLSSAYYVMRLGREPFRSDLPRRCSIPRVRESSRCAALVEWDPPPDHARAGITGYEIAWRPRGERIVGFSMSMWLHAHDALRTMRVKKEEADGDDSGYAVHEWYQAYVFGIPSGVPLQFRVRAANSRGAGPWSEMSDPFMTHTAPKAPARAENGLFLGFDRMVEHVEQDRMEGEDLDAYTTIQAHQINHMLPQVDGGAVHHDMAPARAHGGISDDNIRWKLPQRPDLGDGAQSTGKKSLKDFLFFEQERQLKASIAEKELGQQAYDKVYRHFDSNDDDLAPGTKHPRHVHSLQLKSAYEDYDVTGEPAYTCTREGKLAVEDYMLYSADSLHVKHVMSLPPRWSLTAQHPAQRLHTPHSFLTEPPPFLQHKYVEAFNSSSSGGRGGGVDSEGGSQISQRAHQFKLKQWLESNGGTVDGRWISDWLPHPNRVSRVLPNEEFGSAHIALCAVFEVQTAHIFSTLIR